MAPEIHQNQKYSGTSIDIFAAGIILFIMYAGHPPFRKADPKFDSHYICFCTNKHAKYWNSLSQRQFFSQDLQNLFNSLFAQDPHQRITLAEIKSHPWMKGNILNQQQLLDAFNKRNQVVQASLEKQRLQKLAEKQKQQNNSNFMYTGIGKFRGTNEVQEQFEGLSTQFTNLQNERTMKKYDSSAIRPNDFFTVLDANYLLKLILQNNLWDLQFATKIELYDIQFKMKCERVDENGDSTKFKIEFEEKDEEQIFVNFKKIQGNSVEFYEQVAKIKQIINGQVPEKPQKENENEDYE